MVQVGDEIVSPYSRPSLRYQHQHNKQYEITGTHHDARHCLVPCEYVVKFSATTLWSLRRARHFLGGLLCPIIVGVKDETRSITKASTKRRDSAENLKEICFTDLLTFEVSSSRNPVSWRCLKYFDAGVLLHLKLIDRLFAYRMSNSPKARS